MKLQRALAVGMLLGCGVAAWAQQAPSVVQDEHDKQIKADTERNTKYHNNADDYPANTPVVAPPARVRPAAPHLTSSDIHDMYASADAAAAARAAEFNRALNGAQSHNEEDMMKVADYLIRGYGTNPDKEAAMAVYGAVAKLGPKQAYRIGMLLSEPGPSADNVEAWRAMKAAADGGVAAAKTWLTTHTEPVRHVGELPSILAFVDGVYRQRGVGVKPTTVAAGDKTLADWTAANDEKYLNFKKLAKISREALDAGKATLYGVGVPVDLERATKLFAATARDDKAVMEGVEYSGWAQLQALQKSGTKDLTALQSALFSKEFLHSPLIDYLRAVYSFEAGDRYRERTFLTASVGYFGKDFSQAQVDLAVMSLEGVGGPLDEKAGVGGLTAAAAAGNHNAEYVLGLLYERGLHGVAKDPARAGQLFQSAASAGQPDAQKKLVQVGTAKP